MSEEEIMPELIKKHTKSYHESLIESLNNPSEMSAYLRIAIEEFGQDGDFNFLHIALKNAIEAINKSK